MSIICNLKNSFKIDSKVIHCKSSRSWQLNGLNRKKDEVLLI